ncbi:uncharacterized protein LOC122938039 [Bufo gargarizans]|uniref:uncharacterized protein LOC122938039 n=1 Tax=Bufo gargarizans TaxID=30331 RepID=UPI001CF43CCC|nr:uncharacterized protein LOC122938039 [Bufo gargarizans]
MVMGGRGDNMRPVDEACAAVNLAEDGQLQLQGDGGMSPLKEGEVGPSEELAAGALDFPLEDDAVPCGMDALLRTPGRSSAAAGEAIRGRPVGSFPQYRAGCRVTGVALAPVALERGLGVSAGFIRQSLSRGTWSAYSSVWALWEELIEQVGGSSSLEDFRTLLVFWVGQSYAAGLSFSVASKRVAAVAFWLRLRGMADVSKCFMVRQALKGYRRGALRKDSRRPVSFGVFQMLWTVAESVFVCRRMKCVCLGRLLRWPFSGLFVYRNWLQLVAWVVVVCCGRMFGL